MESDQLVKFKHKDQLLSQFYESKINFLPTFKFDKNSNVYDTSKKMRTPSYTDRVLARFNSGNGSMKVVDPE